VGAVFEILLVKVKKFRNDTCESAKLLEGTKLDDLEIRIGLVQTFSNCGARSHGGRHWSFGGVRMLFV
jgi:hypothetical protein